MNRPVFRKGVIGAIHDGYQEAIHDFSVVASMLPEEITLPGSRSVSASIYISSLESFTYAFATGNGKYFYSTPARPNVWP